MLAFPDFQKTHRRSSGSTEPGAQEAEDTQNAPGAVRIHPWVAAGGEEARVDRAIVEQAILRVLEVDAPMASRLADAWCVWRMWSRQNWIDFADSPAAVTLERARALPLQGFEPLRRRIRNARTGVVLTSPHMGDYLHLLLKVLLELPDRKVFVCRRHPPGDLDSAVLARLAALGLQYELVVTAPDAAVRLARGLRAGGIALLMFDLPAQWGSTTPVAFLGMQVNLVVGPAMLAYRTASHLVPIGTIQEHTGARAFVGTVDRSGLPAEKTSTPSNMTAALAADLVRLIAMAPDQWLHWNFLPELCAGQVRTN